MKVVSRCLFASIFVLVSHNAQGACENPDSLLSRPQPNEVNPCLFSIKHDLGRGNPVNTDFVFQFVEGLLPTDPESRAKTADLKQFDINYVEVAEVVSLLQSEKLIGAYLDFIVATPGSADEIRSFGLGKLYTLQAPTVVRMLEDRNRDAQATVITSLAWGLVNNFYPHINEGNYRRLIVGAHWELLDADHRSPVQTWIESVVRDMIDAR